MKPVLQALLVADHVYIDATTGKKIVAGIFHKLLFKKPEELEIKREGDETRVLIPISQAGHRSGSPFCYISLTDAQGDGGYELRYVDLAEDKPIFKTKFRIKSDDPLQTIELVVPLPELPADKAGTFALELLCNDEPVGSHRIIVAEMPEEQSP